jgi:two-component system chemotaxis sensor kinase CheA
MAATGEAASSIEAMSLEDLVFRQGLSSRDTVSAVSGRGIGLAAVKTELDRLGGSVTVTSRRGRGAQFRFHLPTDRTGFARGAVDAQRTA